MTRIDPKTTPYYKLRVELFAQGKTFRDIGECLEKSPGAVSGRMNGTYPWTIEEGYAVLELIGKSGEDFAMYFPPSGGIRAGGKTS